jgi:26S proteasome regulatory subunit N2
VFYHLGELNESLTYALGAGALFDVNEESEFVTTLLGARRAGARNAPAVSCAHTSVFLPRAAKAIDQYVELRGKPAAEAVEPDARLVAIVERMFERCACSPCSLLRGALFALCVLRVADSTPPGRAARRCFTDGQYQQAIGIALESRRLDKLEEAVVSSGDPPAHLAYALRVCQTLVTSREFRRTVRARAAAHIRTPDALDRAPAPGADAASTCARVWAVTGSRRLSQVLRVLVKLYEAAGGNTDYVSVCQCLMFLDDAPAAAALLERLISGNEARATLQP